jgi:hypothetical protein
MFIYSHKWAYIHTYTHARVRSTALLIGIFNFRDKTLYKSFQFFVSRSDESELNHMAGNSGSPIHLLLQKSLLAQSSPDFLSVALTLFLPKVPPTVD